MGVDWSEIYRATYDDLVRFLHRKVWDADRAHDLAQEVFVRALEHDPDNPRAWLFTVASNLARDEARAAVRQRRHLELIRREGPQRVEPDPAEQIDAANRMRRVERALARLSDRDRDVLLLWDAGLSYSEIARETGLAAGAIGTTLARARQRLVESYEGVEDSDAASG